MTLCPNDWGAIPAFFNPVAAPAKRGYSLDREKGKPQVNYRMVTDRRGCPVAVSVFEGDMSDPCTVMTQVDKV
jgi:transposase